MAAPAFRRIFIVCPAQARTGGPEALHQLGHALCQQGHAAAMVYTSDDTTWFTFREDGAEVRAPTDAMPAEYGHYAVPRAIAIPDAADVAVVVPEIWPALTTRFRRAKVFLWWLSVDHALEKLAEAGGLPALPAEVGHLCQSHYALSWLAARGVRGRMLSDYTSPAMAATAEEIAGRREPRVLYPARGREAALRLRERVPEAEWRELSGMEPGEVRAAFLASRVYVDFGTHPGKDRMPREAASLGCCVVTGRRGAAGNAFDVPIPWRYKFRDTRLARHLAARAVRRLVANHGTRIGDFAGYRAVIAGERAAFFREVAAIFGAGPRS